MSKSLIYIAGPMTGYEDYNFAAFHAAAAMLESQGWNVINPAENFDGQQDLPWEMYLRLAVTQVATADAIVMLPDWGNSKGANLERHIAVELDLALYDIEDFCGPPDDA